MTPLSLLQFVEALLWCVLLFGSFSGFGALLFRVFGIRRALVASAATAGFGVVVALGGVLNLLHLITRPVLLGLTLTGLVALIILRPRFTDPAQGTPFAGISTETQGSQQWTRVFLILFALVFCIRVAATVHWSGYQQSDDFNFYLGEPLKMLQLHFYAPDPFSERRIMASIGASYYLQDFLLAALPLENLQMADRTLGMFLLATAAYAIGSRFRLTSLQRAVFCLLVMIVPQLSFNLTYVILPSALLLGMVVIAADHDLLDRRPVLLGVLLGLITAFSAGLKNTYLPHPVFFVIALAILQARRKGLPAGLKLLLVAAGVCGLAMLPWMYADHVTSGTWFYPSLGPGFHYTAYGIFKKPSSVGLSAITHKVLPFCAPVVLVWVLTWLFGERDEETDSIMALMGASSVAALLIGLATGGESIRRYNYPAVVPCLVLLYVVASRRLNHRPGLGSRMLQFAGVALACAASLAIGLNGFTMEFHQIPICLRESFEPFAIVPADDVKEYAAVEQALPTDAAALATVRNSFLFNFHTHTINIADIPGAAGLPPGWPNRGTGDELAQYLLASHIRYLVFDYKGWARTDADDFNVIQNPAISRWIRDERQITRLALLQFTALTGSRRQIYNDGRIAIVDLGTPAVQQKNVQH